MESVIFIENIKEDSKEKLKSEFKKVFSKDDSVAIKLHMGERGNKFYLKPDFVKIIVAALNELETKPFLFDSPVMYPGGRDTEEKYLKTAAAHGFTKEAIGCPIVISNKSEIIQTDHLKAEVCKPLIDADGILVLSHVKGHMCTGFGGAIKNLGMGGVSKKTKADIHNFGNPVMVGDCAGCSKCIKTCPVSAISLKNNKAIINYSGCWGCGACIEVCPKNALKPKIANFDTLISEGAEAVLRNIKKRYFINVIKDITQLCDCCSDPGAIVLDDIGIVMGKEIVAVEKASFDLINNKAGKDLFKQIHHKSPIEHIKIAQKLGLGNMEYELIKE